MKDAMKPILAPLFDTSMMDAIARKVPMHDRASAQKLCVTNSRLLAGGANFLAFGTSGPMVALDGVIRQIGGW